MSDRKVLNKYFPPDYDPSRIPRLPKTHQSRSFNLRTMAPFNMRCNTCRCYIYKARKFNSRMEVAEGETYLGLRLYRFHIRCSTCCSEIVWKTDLENGDYMLESGATRNFEALRTAEKQAEAEKEAEEEELANNPMKSLEKRTNQSRQEMDLLETLEDLRELNKRQAGTGMIDAILETHSDARKRELEDQEKADEDFIKSVMEAKRFKRIEDDTPQASSNQSTASTSQGPSTSKLPPSLVDHAPSSEVKSRSQKSLLMGLVRVKKGGEPTKEGLGSKKNAVPTKEDLGSKKNAVPTKEDLGSKKTAVPTKEENPGIQQEPQGSLIVGYSDSDSE